jgi:hypothetical protein
VWKEFERVAVSGWHWEQVTATRKESLRVQTSGSRSETSSDVMKELQREGAWGDDVCDGSG